MYVFVLNPSSEYCNSVLCALLAGLTHVCVGAIFTMLMLYSIKTNFDDLHVLFCTLGFYLFTVEAVLSLHFANGWSTPMRMSHRKLAHVMLQVTGSSFVILGVVLATRKYGKGRWSAHAVTGCLATLGACLSIIAGILLLLFKKYAVKLLFLHIFCGLVTLILAATCVCAILIDNSSFKGVNTEALVYVMVGLVIFMTVFLVVSSFNKCVAKF